MRIVLFGTGSGLGDFLSLLPEGVQVVGLCDNNVREQGKTILAQTVLAPQAITVLEFDYVVVTARAGDAMRRQLVEMGIEREKILLFYPTFDGELRNVVNRDVEVLNRKLGMELHPLALCAMQLWPQPKIEGVVTEDDYCRLMSIRLAAERIERQRVAGAIAELGVYKGEMAAVLSRLFPKRKLYLFDTFEGFSENDLADGVERKHSKAAVGEFQNTSVELVLGKLAQRERVEVRKGYFPESADGLEEQFSFVSLDVDLYKPTLAGLHYFYPRLSHGGAIFVHDYNNTRFKGVQSAVDEFVDITGVPLVQLPDLAGTVVLSK